MVCNNNTNKAEVEREVKLCGAIFLSPISAAKFSGQALFAGTSSSSYEDRRGSKGSRRRGRRGTGGKREGLHGFAYGGDSGPERRFGTGGAVGNTTVVATSLRHSAVRPVSTIKAPIAGRKVNPVQ